jgi:Ca-activated chloride channel family protein
MTTKRMRRAHVAVVAAAALAAGAFIVGVPKVQAAGLLIADSGLGGVLEVQEHNVQVTINNGVAVTEVTQVFRNTENRQVEALYTFPVPKGGSVANFSMWINGKEMVGEVVEKQRAREIYDSYKRVRRDPGLLEQTDYKTFEMRIFPIGPRAQQKVQISYYQELDFDNDWVTYVYPLATAARKDVNSKTTGKFAISLQAKSEVPIVSMESPSHGEKFVIVKHGESYFQASLETKTGDLNRDVVLAYRVSRPHTGIDVVASRRAGEDGYLCLTLTAGEELSGKAEGADYVFVLDASGSMADDGKLGLSRGSIEAFLNSLDARDRFEIITFNVTPTTLFNKLREVGAESRAQAGTFLGSQAARGGTVLRPAIEAAYRYAQNDRTLNVVILSDGMTEQGERATLLDMSRTKPAGARIFCVGVGNDANRPLLEQLAEDAGGLALFVSPGDNMERQAKAFRRKLMRPAATGLQITFDGGGAYDVEPARLPNLFHGMPVRLYGRYRAAGVVKVNVRADVAGLETKKALEVTLPESDGNNPEIERMWAWHKVERLLKEADRTGAPQPVVGEIVRLGEGYSIATQYTSFIVLENDGEYKRWKIDQRNVLRMERDRKPQQQLLAQLDTMRSKAAANIGPLASGAEANSARPVGQPSAGDRLASSSPRSSPPQRPGDLDLRRGGGPIGPFGVAGIAALAVVEWRRRVRRITAKHAKHTE